MKSCESTMSELPWNSVFTLIGVTVGFGLTELATFWRNKRRRKMIRKALHNELAVVYEGLVKARDKGKLAFEDFPLVTDSYDSLKIELASMLPPSNLAKVQRAYSQIKTLGKPLGEDTQRGYVVIPGGGFLYQHDLSEEIRVIEEAISVLRD
jgi:hypothetical protein